MLKRLPIVWLVVVTFALYLVIFAVFDSLFLSDRTFADALFRTPLHSRLHHSMVFVGLLLLIWAVRAGRGRLATAHRKHQASESRYRQLVEIAPICVVVHDSGGIRFANRSALRLYGYEDFRPFVGDPVLRFVHPDDHDRVRHRISRLLEGKEESPSDTMRVNLPGNESREITTTSMATEFEGRNAVVTFFRDITELNKAHQRLKNSQERLQLALDAAQDGVWDWDILSGRMVYNEAWAEMLGYELTDLEPGLATWRDLIHPDDRERAVRTLEDHLRGDTAKYMSELRLRHADGRYVWVLDRGRIVARDENGNPVRMAGTHRDISMRKSAELALEIRNRIARIFLTGRDVEIYSDINRIVCETTKSSAGLFGTIDKSGRLRVRSTRREQGGRTIAGQPVGMDFPPERMPPFFQEVLDRREPVIHNEPMNLGRDHLAVANVMAVPIRVGEDIIGMILTANRTDGYQPADAALVESVAEYIAPILQSHLSDKAKEAQLRQAQKMEALGALAGGIAHDFNNILQAILGFTTLANEQVDDDGPLANDLARVLKAANRGKDLVKSILLFSRREEQERQALAVEPVIREAVDLLKPTIPSTIEVQANLNADDAEIMADPSQISQIVLNLATNAFHAMEDIGGILRIDLDLVSSDCVDPDIPAKLRNCDLVSLSISDTGCGMSAEVMDRLFDPFFTTKEVGKGTGLGLSVVHGIVVAHDGEIRISSEPGCGTVVRVFLPRIATESESAHKAAPAGSARNRGRILFVDDEQDITDFAEAVLNRSGHDVTAVQDSRQALARVQQDPHGFDLLVTDLTMPHITGLQLATEVTSLRADLPVILITGVSDKPDWELGPRKVIRAVVHKPFDRQTLCETIETVLAEAGRNAGEGEEAD